MLWNRSPWRRLATALSVAAVWLWAGGVLEPAFLDKEVRSPCCAGSWYPGDAALLGNLVDNLLEKASPLKIDGKPVALISPHAGYQYSAPVAAAAYRALRGHVYKRVFVLAFSHRLGSTYQGVDVPKNLTAYQTPLGPVPIDREVCDRLLKSKGFSAHSDVDKEEHSLELQLPFLQRLTPGFQLVPLLVGRMSLGDFTTAAEAIGRSVDQETLLVASSDFTHFGPGYGYQPFKDEVPGKLQELADLALTPLKDADFDGLVDHLDRTKDTICGYGPILLLLRTLAMRGGAVGVRAALDTSGHMTGDWTNSVTYQSVVFGKRPDRYPPEEREVLLRLARETVTAHLNKKKLPDVDPSRLSPALRNGGATFVTLRNHGELRGCIGNVLPEGPLYQSVVDNALKASEDFRFKRNPVTAGELTEIDVEVSVLSVPKRIDRKEDIVVGRDGLIMTKGPQAGLLLPQVAYELGWTRVEFLAQACLKAGLKPDCWTEPDAVVYSFQAEVFGEPEPPTGGATKH